MVQEDIYQKVAVLENDMEHVKDAVEKHSDILEKQIERNEVLVEMKAILQMQIEESKERNKQMKDFGCTLAKVDKNLTNLNHNYEQMKVDVGEFGNRVIHLEQKFDENKIDPVKLFKSILSYILTGLGSIAIALIIAYLVYEFGWKN